MILCKARIMLDIVGLCSDGKMHSTFSYFPLSKARRMSIPNIDTDGGDGPHTGTPQASRDLANDHYHYNSSRNDHVNTTSKERESKTTVTETSDPEKPSESQSLIDKIASFLQSKKDWWYIELGACLISAIAMITLIIILHRHNGKPLPKWPLHITIATFVAVCSNVTKATLLMPVVCTFQCFPFSFRAVS